MSGEWNFGSEKGLEVEESAVASVTVRTNDEEAGSLATGKPADPGKSFEGEGRLGGGSVVGECRRSARNQANPMIGCGVQQTREAVCGANRRSREERQGRNAFGCGNPEPRATESGRTW
jgi:hypothetical protein